MEKLLTVTIPAYNAEKYIEYTLNSLCVGYVEKRQLEQLEILVVDDGSADQTGAIADQYAEKYPDIGRVIHKENGGHGSGINCGIREARGRYFKVIDADDWVDSEAFWNLVRTLEPCEDDAVVSGFYWRLDNGNRNPESFLKEVEIKEPFPGVIYSQTYLFDEVAENLYIKMHGVTWRTAILKQLPMRIDEKCFYVDSEYILYPIPWIQTIRFIPDFVYQYRIGREGQSVSPERLLRNRNDYEKVLGALLLFYEDCVRGKYLCTEPKLHYIESGIARCVSGRIKIFLSQRADRKVKEELIQSERILQNKYPAIYERNRNKAVKVLRLSRYWLYRAAVFALKHSKRKV